MREKIKDYWKIFLTIFEVSPLVTENEQLTKKNLLLRIEVLKENLTELRQKNYEELVFMLDDIEEFIEKSALFITRSDYEIALLNIIDAERDVVNFLKFQESIKKIDSGKN